MEDVPAQEVAVEIEGEEEDGDELVEVDLSAYEERIAELEAALADEKERSAQLQAKVVDLEMQLRAAHRPRLLRVAHRRPRPPVDLLPRLPPLPARRAAVRPTPGPVCSTPSRASARASSRRPRRSTRAAR